MNEYIKNMVDEAIQFIDSLSIDELEKEFKSFGLSAIRRKDVQYFTPVKVTEFTCVNVNKICASANNEFYYLDDCDYKNAA